MAISEKLGKHGVYCLELSAQHLSHICTTVLKVKRIGKQLYFKHSGRNFQLFLTKFICCCFCYVPVTRTIGRTPTAIVSMLVTLIWKLKSVVLCNPVAWGGGRVGSIIFWHKLKMISLMNACKPQTHVLGAHPYWNIFLHHCNPSFILFFYYTSKIVRHKRFYTAFFIRLNGII